MYADNWKFNYTNDIRAILFKNYTSWVNNIDDVKKVIRYNNNEVGNICDGISPRCDLLPVKPFVYGGIDGKVVGWEEIN